MLNRRSDSPDRKYRNKYQVSVVTPIYNTQTQYIADLYESLVKQSVLWEWIVVDDGSTNEAGRNFVHFLKDKDPRIKLVISTQNQGACHARNTGLNIARSEWIKFIDSDDWISDDLLFNEISESKADTDLIISTAKAVIKTDSELILVRTHSRFDRKNPLCWFLTVGSGHPASLLYKKSRAISIGGWDESLSADQDGDFFARYISGGVTINSNVKGYSYYRQHDGARISSKISFRSVESRIQAHCWIQKHYSGGDNKYLLKYVSLKRWLRIYNLAYRSGNESKNFCASVLTKDRRYTTLLICKAVTFLRFF